MRTRKSRAYLLGAAFTASLLIATPVRAIDPVDSWAPIEANQDGSDEGHLPGPGEWGKIELVDVVQLYDATDPALGPGLIADVGVDPDGDYAYLANWGFPDCAGPEAGGMTSPDAGIYIVDISGYVFRAFFALPPLTNEKGDLSTVVNARHASIEAIAKQESAE